MKISSLFVTGGLPAASACVSLATEAPAQVQTDSEELKALFDEDQADRRPETGKPIDWNVVGPRDDARERRVKELLASDSLNTGADFFHAAMVLQHSGEPDGYLLCHDLCIVAISKGEMRAKWLAAASIDRFLVSAGRLQRFGTQFGGGRPGAPMRLRPVDPSVSDELRREFNVPPIAEAKKREAKMKEQFEAQRPKRELAALTPFLFWFAARAVLSTSSQNPQLLAGPQLLFPNAFVFTTPLPGRCW